MDLRVAMRPQPKIIRPVGAAEKSSVKTLKCTDAQLFSDVLETNTRLLACGCEQEELVASLEKMVVLPTAALL